MAAGCCLGALEIACLAIALLAITGMSMKWDAEDAFDRFGFCI
jgi:hypothetical protein